MDTTYIFVIVTIMGALLNLFLSKTPKTINWAFEVFLAWFLLVMIGIGSIWAFVGHVFLSNLVAANIGWPAGNPFQLEVGVANLSYGILGLLSWKFRDNFWLATIIVSSIFYLGAAIVHLTNIMQTGNMAPGNAGYALYIDIMFPLILIALYLGFKLTRKNTDFTESQ